MGLTLITGRAGAGIVRHTQDRLDLAARAGCEVVLVVPGFADVRRAREELAHSAPMGIEVTTFEQWLEALWSRRGDGRLLVSPVLRRSLVQSACVEAPPPLDLIAASPGLADVVATIAARSAGLNRADGHGPVTTALAEILGRYERVAEELGVVEPGEAVRLLAHQGALSDATVVWSGFTDLSTTQLRFIRALSDSNEVTVSLTWAEGCAATEALTGTVAVLADYATSHLVVPRPSAISELDALEAQLYEPQEPLQATGEVVLSEAAGPEAEAVLVARAARRAIADGFEAERVAVVFRDLARRRGLVEAAFRSAGISFSADFQVEFASTPLGSALLALAAVVKATGGRVELLHFLQGPFADADIGCGDAGFKLAEKP